MVNPNWNRRVHKCAVAHAQPVPHLLRRVGNVAPAKWFIDSLVALNDVTFICDGGDDDGILRIPLQIPSSQNVRCIFVCLHSLDNEADDHGVHILQMRINTGKGAEPWVDARFYELVSFYRYFRCNSDRPVLLYSTCMSLCDQNEIGAPMPSDVRIELKLMHGARRDFATPVMVDVVGSISKCRS